MKISVVVPAYNEEKNIVRCLEALKNQTVKPYEIITSDGGSTDKTVELAKKYGKAVVAKKRGIAHGRNLGGFAAAGDIICFTDADCEPSPQWLEAVEKAFVPGVVFVTGPVRAQTSSLMLRAVYWAVFSAFVPLLFFLGRPLTSGWNICCTREAFLKVNGFNEQLTTAEDLDFIAKIIKLGKSVYSPRAIVNTSTRREEKFGLFRLFLFHLKNGLKYVLFKKSANYYPDVR